ncbi:MAG: hypothetical protein ABI627_13855 [Polyangiaceae bacterium]
MKIFGFIALGGLAAAGLLPGCATRSSSRSEAPVTAGGTSMGAHDVVELCPTRVPGASVASVDVEGGAALVFRTNADKLADLRQNVREMAELHNRAEATGQLTISGRTMAASTASEEDTEEGARLVLLPKDIGQLGALRDDVRTRSRRIANGECPIIPPGTEGMPGIPPSPGADQMAHEPPPSGK